MNHKKHLLTIVALGILIILTLSASTLKGGGGGADSPRSISVTGSGKVHLKPDIAMINVGVHTENEDVSVALSENNAKALSVREALIAFGVKPEDIQTTSFSVYQSQVYGPMGEMLGLKYMVDNSVYITVRDLAKLGDVLTTLVNKGANNIYGITFDVADRVAALTEARKAAVADAKAQADELAAAAGVKVGQVISVSTATTGSAMPIYAEYGYGGGGGMAAASAPISSGQLIVTVDAYLTYELK